MNLRKVDRYNIGLDIGTGSVGWAVTDESGKLCHFKGKPTWGSRLFASAETAADARSHRGQRRRYERRRWRLNLLQGFFADEMAQLDPDFFNRLNSSYLVKGDRNWNNPLFNGGDFTEKDYYSQNPTIYHLRKRLMESGEKEDLRLVYLALHNIVKCRGNFLREGEKLSAKDANMGSAVERFVDALIEWCDENGIVCDCFNCKGEIAELLQDEKLHRADKRDRLADLFMLGKTSESAPDYNKKKFEKALSSALVGYKADLSQVFLQSIEESNIYLKDDEKVEAFASNCPDEGLELFESMRAMYSSFVLMGILKGSNGRSLSYVKIDEYETYKNDLRLLKRLVKQYAAGSYDEFFRGETYAGTTDYDPSTAAGYTKYNLGVKKLDYDGFKKEVKKLLEKTAAAEDQDYLDMMARFDEETFLRRQKTSDNGCIPYQLHLEEYERILENQGKHYPFLLEYKKELCSLVTFRIPYYVGPLSRKNQSLDNHGKSRFAWSSRKPGMEDAVIKPWNWEDIIDKNRCAEDFINRMTSNCSYLLGEPVVPKCSLLYEEFCVLNELNGAKFSYDDKDYRFDTADREAMMVELFRKGKVSYKRIKSWFAENGRMEPEVKGAQGETGFESRLGSYIFFCKDIFGVTELPLADYPMIEEIILWSTLFEDRSILKDKLVAKYGKNGNGRLDDDQIKKICRKRFTGWGKLSRKFLTEMKAETDQGRCSIMDVLREGNPNGSKPGEAMVLMEIVTDGDLNFEKLISDHNGNVMSAGMTIEDLPGSPALRRSLNQAQRIVKEIVKIAGKDPISIYIEETRGEDKKKRGKRTNRRYNHLVEALTAFKEQVADCDGSILKELKGLKPEDLDERLSLYFMQAGKSLYSEKPIDLEGLLRGSGEYEVDHILPQSYIKDDSFENKALVFRSENQRKLDTLLLDDGIRKRCKGYWKELHDAGLIGKKKFKNLMRTSVGDKDLKGFINRQLVETSQIVKYARQLLGEAYPNTAVRGIRAGISHQIREKQGFVKCRDANDYHHAHDALLACAVGRFMDVRYQGIIKNPIAMTKMVRSMVKEQGLQNEAHDDVKPGKKNYARTLPGDTNFVVRGFCTDWVNKETGECWMADDEIAEIRRQLNFKDCFISRMPEITSGAYWDSTIYSPKNSKKALLISTKKDKPAAAYGSFSREQFAFFFVFEAKGKKGKTEIGFEPVPVSVAEKMGCGSDAIERYARELCEESGTEFVRVLRPIVQKYQLVEVDDSRLYLTGKKEARNASQLAFGLEETGVLIAALDDDSDVCNEDLMALFELVCKKYKRYAPRLNGQMKVSELKEGFEKAKRESQVDALRKMLQIAAAQTNMVDLREIGGAKCAGCMRLTMSKTISSPGFFFIDQSVTGMYERRYKLGL